MASGAMQKCCVSGVLHEGTPVGEVKTIGNSMLYTLLILYGKLLTRSASSSIPCIPERQINAQRHHPPDRRVWLHIP
jgi:hypothetical protein